MKCMNPTWILPFEAVWRGFLIKLSFSCSTHWACPLKAGTSLYMQKSVGLFKERVAGVPGECQSAPAGGCISVYTYIDVCFMSPCRTSVIMGNPRMKKLAQQTRVNSGLCFLKYLGNSSDTEVTMVSMVANWNRDEWEGDMRKCKEREEMRE